MVPCPANSDSWKTFVHKSIYSNWINLFKVNNSLSEYVSFGAGQIRLSEDPQLSVQRILTTEAVNTVCLGFSDEFIEFSQSWFYRWFLAKITDFGGEDEGFLAKITDFWRRLRISLSLPMFTVHTNERGTCTCLHWACADILMRESPLLSMCRCSTGHVQTC